MALVFFRESGCETGDRLLLYNRSCVKKCPPGSLGQVEHFAVTIDARECSQTLYNVAAAASSGRRR